VVAVLLTVLGISGSLQRVIAGTGHADRALVLRTGSKSESQSTLTREDVVTIDSAPGISRTDAGRPQVSPELLAQYQLIDSARGVRAEVLIRGVDSDPRRVRPEIHLLGGRPLKPGLHELLVGKNARAQYPELALNRSINIGGAPWTIVGIFDAGNEAHSSELLADSDTLLSALHRNAYNSVLVLLDSPDAFPAFKDFLTQNPAISVDVYREPQYYQQQSESVLHAWAFVAYVVGGIMALGAMIGAANTLYSSVDARRVEIATLRAVGFRPNSVLIAVLTESPFSARCSAPRSFG
jgi:putative ABC transport system permease protein